MWDHVVERAETCTVGLEHEGVRLIRVIGSEDPLEHEFLLQVEERERLLFDLLKTDAVPLLDDFAINIKESALASTVMLGNDLV